MNHKELTRRSKFLSLVLRHRPETIGVELDEQGWVSVQDLLAKSDLDSGTLDTIVEQNNKKRFEFNDDKTKIRARQGHSVDVDLNYEPADPPEFLYHGTVDKFMQNIRRDGLRKMKRHHVHMSPDIKTASVVGQRRGKPIILKIAAQRMLETGVKFFVTENDVWLTDHVPPEFLEEHVDP
jgi:putative RNA 2'-phosphotransferase